MSENNMNDIAELFKKLKFRKKLIGGVDERDVWRKLEALQKEYRRVYEARETRFRTILEMHGIDPSYMDDVTWTQADQVQMQDAYSQEDPYMAGQYEQN